MLNPVSGSRGEMEPIAKKHKNLDEGIPPFLNLKKAIKLISIAGQEVPKEILEHIFSYLPPEQLSSINRVCKLWYQVTSRDSLWQSYQPSALFPKAFVYDRKFWEMNTDLDNHGLVFEEGHQPCIQSKHHYFELKNMESRVKEGKGISILTLPKGLSFNKVSSLKTGKEFELSHLWPEYIQAFGDVEIKQTVTIAITNGIFERSQELTYRIKIKLLNELKCNARVLPFATVAILRMVHVKKPLGGLLLKSTGMLCEDEIKTVKTLLVESDTSNHLYIHDNLKPYKNIGIGGIREFATRPSK